MNVIGYYVRGGKVIHASHECPALQLAWTIREVDLDDEYYTRRLRAHLASLPLCKRCGDGRAR